MNNEEKYKEFVNAVSNMRLWQKRYFDKKTRTQEVLREAIMREAYVDNLLTELEKQ